MYPPPVQQNRAGRAANFVRYWLPVMVWMVLIFGFSSDAKSYQHSSTLFEPLLRWLFPRMPQETISEIHHLFRKTCHLTEYAILAGLVWRAVRKPVRNDTRPWNWTEAGFALSMVFTYAATDELHQVFVPTRTALVSDVLIDTSGGLALLVVLWLRHGGVAAMFAWLRRKIFKPG
jgi:VanZ family protein